MSSASLPTLPRLPTIPLVGSTGGGSGEVVVEMAVLQNFDQTEGDLTATKFNDGLHGEDWGTWSEAHEGNVGVSNTHSVITALTIGLPFTLRVGGVDYDGMEGNGMLFDFTTDPTEYDAYQLAPGITVNDMVLMSLEISAPDLVPGEETTYSNDLYVLNGGNFSVSQNIINFAGQRLALAHSEGSFGLLIGTAVVWYLKAIFRDVTNGQTKVFIQRVVSNGSGGWMLGDAIGMSRSVTGSAGSLANIRFQDYLRPPRGTGSMQVKLFAMTQDTTFPPWNPGTLSGPDTVGANRTEEEQITIGISGPWALVRIERSVNGGGFSTLVASRDIALDSPVFSYVDDAVSVPNTYQYRCIGLVGAYETEPSDSGVIDLSEPFAEWVDGIPLGSASESQLFANHPDFATGNFIDLPAGTVQKLRVYVGAVNGTVPVKLALYDTDGLTLLTSGSGTASAVGYLEIDVADEVIGAGSYLLMLNADPDGANDVTFRYGTGAAGGQRFGASEYDTFPQDPNEAITVGGSAYAAGVQVLAA